MYLNLNQEKTYLLPDSIFMMDVLKKEVHLNT